MKQPLLTSLYLLLEMQCLVIYYAVSPSSCPEVVAGNYFHTASQYSYTWLPVEWWCWWGQVVELDHEGEQQGEGGEGGGAASQQEQL